MKITIGEIDLIISEELSQLMETYQAAFGESERWRFIRQVQLKRINRIRNRIVEQLRRQGAITDGNGEIGNGTFAK